MSHIVEMSYANGPGVGQNGLSSTARHGLISEWYSAVDSTVVRSAGPSTATLPRCSRQVDAVAARRDANDDGPGPQSASRLRRACSAPRSENPIRSSTTWPGSLGPAHIRPNGRSVVGRMWSKSNRVPPGIRRRSYQSIWRQAGVSHSTCTASGAPSMTTSPCATPGSTECRNARSGTVRP